MAGAPIRTERFDFVSDEGHPLVGRLDLPEGTPHAYAVFAHCFTCTKNSLAAVRISRALAAHGIGVLRFDFTGLGESEGDFSASGFSGNVRDLLAAVRQMGERGCAPALLIGHSLGGAATIAAAVGTPEIKAVAVIGAPADVSHVTRLLAGGLEQIQDKGEAEVDLGGQPFMIRRSFIDDLNAHDQTTTIAGLRRPLLILHSPEDRVVDIENAMRIFAAAQQPKSLVALDSADHLLTRPEDAGYAADMIAAWSSRYIAKPVDAAPRADA